MLGKILGCADLRDAGLQSKLSSRTLGNATRADRTGSARTVITSRWLD
jgi:hypothetical protein